MHVLQMAAVNSFSVLAHVLLTLFYCVGANQTSSAVQTNICVFTLLDLFVFTVATEASVLHMCVVEL